MLAEGRRALLIQLEFPTWARARAWSYAASFGLEEGLRANKFECLTVPAFHAIGDQDPSSWLSHVRRLFDGQQFDLAWVWLVHNEYSRPFLEWLAVVAPVRVGFVMESLRYDEEDYRVAPHLRSRASLVHEQIRYMTHVVACDERDVEEINANGRAAAFWWPSTVPGRCIVPPAATSAGRVAAFYGDLYGERGHWLKRHELEGLLTKPEPPEDATTLPAAFDALNRGTIERLSSGWRPNLEDLTSYVNHLRSIRENIFDVWMQGLMRWPAIVNLPSLAKFYPGRVVEAMAAGRPVISWSPPDRERNRKLFRDGKEILLFDTTRPDLLRDHLVKVLNDVKYRYAIAAAAHENVKALHSSEMRVREVLEWIRQGVACGERRMPNGDGILPAKRSEGDHPTQTSTPTDRFYTKLFIDTPYWSTPHPNPDEAARWSKIASFLEMIARRRPAGSGPLRMIEVGCGRGWLTNLLSTCYGDCEGVEPVAEVAGRARELFPSLRFTAGTAKTILDRPDFSPYDVVICSEVIEHVPQADQPDFLHTLVALLKPGGYLILSTPRGDAREQWQRIAPPNQPIEDWLTETELRSLLRGTGLYCLGLERVYVELPSLRFIPAPTPVDQRALSLLPIYQVWACQLSDGSHHISSFNLPPMVSVIVPTYNRPAQLREALETILRQTMQDFEIIVVNDGDIDVEDIIHALDHDGRIIYARHDRNRGLAASRNTGLRLAKGKYVAYLDDDDRYYPEHLEMLVRALEAGTFRAAYSDAWRVHERWDGCQRVEINRDAPYSYDFSAPQLLVSNYFPVLCVMHERALIDEVGGFDESLFAHEDWDLWIRIATRTAFLHVPLKTAEFTWRTDGSSMTSGDRDTYFRTTEIIYRKYRPYAERLPGVLQAQQEQLAVRAKELRRQSVDCSIIVPVWNRRELTEQCLRALSRTTQDVNYEVVIVDNGSTDTTGELLARLGGDVRIIRNTDNRGFAKACNQGARAASGRYLVFLNNDTIPLPGWLKALVDEIESYPDVAVVGSKLLYPDGSIQHAGVVFSRDFFLPYHVYRGFPAAAPAVNSRREFQVVTGACMLVRREAFDAVGGFDEEYVNGFEDVDLCLKIRERGGRVIYQPRSVLYHLESQTPGRKTYEDHNVRRLIQRWGHHWWLPDEDSVYVSDGYFYTTWTEDHLLKDRLAVLPPQTRDQWERVAAAQRAAHRRDFTALASLLAEEGWPEDKGVLRWAAGLCRWAKLEAHAPAFWQRLLSIEEAADARVALAKYALEAGRVEEAEEHLTTLLSRSPDHGEGWLLRGVLAMQRHSYADAEAAFGRALQYGGDVRKAHMGIGMAAMGAGDPGRAWPHFSEALRVAPDDQDALHWLLRSGTALERWADLFAHLRRFTARNSADLAARFALAGVAVRLGRHDVARSEYHAIHLLNPGYDGLNELATALNGGALTTTSAS